MNNFFCQRLGALLMAGLLLSLPSARAEPLLDLLFGTYPGGGSPQFRSPLPPTADRFGSAPNGSFITGSAEFADYYRSGGLYIDDSSSRYRTLQKAGFSGGDHLRWSGAVLLRQRGLRLGYQHTGIEQAFSSDRRSAAGGVELGLETKSLQAYGSILAAPDHRPELDAQLELTPLPQLAAGIGFQQASGDLLLNGHWHEEPVTLAAGNGLNRLSGWIDVKPLRQLELAARIGEGTVSDLSVDGLDPTLLLSGRTWDYNLAGSWHPAPFSLTLGGRGLLADFDGPGEKGGIRFARITRFHSTADALYLQLLSSTPSEAWTTQLTLEGGRGNLSGRGHVEFWPWTAGLVDFLGLRRYFVATGEAEWFRGQFSLQNNRGAWRWGSALHLMDLYPDMTLRHWQPEWLGIGITDLRVNRLTVERMWVGMIALYMGVDRGPLELSYRLEQLVPVKTWSSDGEGTGGEPGTGTSGTGGRSYGGGFHKLTLSWRG